MSAITWADVKAVDAGLSKVNVTAQGMFLAAANALISEPFGGDDSPTFRLVRVYYAAHYGTLSIQGIAGPSGNIVGESAGGLSRQYANNSPAGTDPLWDKTIWGQSYRNIVRSSCAAFPIVG